MAPSRTIWAVRSFEIGRPAQSPYANADTSNGFYECVVLRTMLQWTRLLNLGSAFHGATPPPSSTLLFNVVTV